MQNLYVFGLVCFLLFFFSNYILLEAIDVVRPLFVDAVVYGDPANNFSCLADKDWDARKLVNSEFIARTCRKNANTHTNIPVVFVYWVKNPLAQNHATFDSMVLSLNTAARFNNNVTLLLFGKLKNFPIQQRLLDNVEIREVRHPRDSVLRSFESFNTTQYRHNSPNDFEYELFCFKRWFAMLEFAEVRKLSGLFVADLDVLVLSNITLEAGCYLGCPSFGKYVYSAYFTLPELRAFVEYIKVFYATPGRVEAASTEYNVVSDMIVHLLFTRDRIKQDSSLAFCTSATMTADNMVPREPLVGDLDFFHQDHLGMVYATRAGYVDRLVSVVHFQGWRKRLWERCA